METAASSLSHELDARLVALWRQIGRVDRHDLSRTAASVLASLRDNGPMRITALAAAESVAQPSMTTLVARMERDGLAQRAPDPTDARAVLVRISDEGLARLTRIRTTRAAAVEARLTKLDPEERAVLEAALPVLDKLISEGAV